MPPLVTWFRNNHEHSLHYFKFGLMQMARRGEILYREIANENGHELIPEAIRKHAHRRTVAVRIDEGSRHRILILDGEDSIFQTSFLIQHCDLYFSCTYRRKFFDGEAFDLELPWQTECELIHYRERYSELQNAFAADLHRARPLMPIGPGMEMPENLGMIREKLGSLRHRLSKLREPWLDWAPQFDRFQRRWAYLHKLRDLVPNVDVALKDSLWGWPRHRVALHQSLATAGDRYSIRAELHYREANPYEYGSHSPPSPEDFPMRVGGGVAGSYEEALASSRLGVFATGFHYGCRNIVTLCWFLGLKTFTDPLSFEAIYDFADLEPMIHRSGSWIELPEVLDVAKSEGQESRKRRQIKFDAVALPGRAAKYLLETTIGL